MRTSQAMRSIARAERGQVGGLIAVSIFVALTEALGLSLIVPILEFATGGQSQQGIGRWISPALQAAGPRAVYVTIFMGFVLFFFRAALKILQAYLKNQFVWRTAERWGNAVLSGYLHEPRLYDRNERRGVLFHNVMDETAIAASCLLKIIEYMIKVILSLFLAASLLLTDARIAALILLYCLLVFLLLRRSTRQASLSQGRSKVELFQDLSASVSEILNNHETIKAFALEERFLKNFQQKNQRARALQIRMNTMRALPPPLLELGLIFILFVVFLFSETLTGAKQESLIPVLGMFLIVSQQLLNYFSALISERINLYQLMPSLLLVEGLSRDRQEKSKPEVRRTMPPFAEKIEFQSVSFAYPGRRIFENFQLSIQKNQTVLIVGPSGSGKSTLIALLMGFLKPDQGKILLDDQDLQSYDPGSWRQQIAYTGQNVQLFHGTLEENIVIGRNNAPPSALARAVQDAGLETFIETLPEGMKTQVGEGGLMLSGGQRQRIAIARALLRESPILIFDEATSAQDTAGNQAMRETIARFRKEKTILIISHREDLVEEPDQTVRLGYGKR